jgi:hypothetical protein
MDIKIEKDNRDGYYYVRERVNTQWKMRSRHPTMDIALRSLLKDSDSKVETLLQRVARYMCGGHYEPRNDDEALLAKEIFETVGIS